MKDARLEEIDEGLMEQFRVVRSRKGDREEERKIAETLANMAGKVIKTYLVELAYASIKEPMPFEVAMAIKGDEAKRLEA
jgi:hypothetical protein